MLYDPSVLVDGDPLVAVAVNNVLIITTPEPPFPEDPGLAVLPAPPPPPPVFAVPLPPLPVTTPLPPPPLPPVVPEPP